VFELCLMIHGQRHCFPIPVLVENFHVPHGPGPVNMPELELAVSVLQLVEAVQPVVQGSALTKQLAEVSQHFIQQVQAGLPPGVELTRSGGAGRASAG